MAAERRARIALYRGPLSDADRRELPGLEKTGNYVAERKHDGMWAAMHVGDRGSRAHRFESRTGLDVDLADLGGMDVDMGEVEDTILIGEMEASTQSSLERIRGRGYRVFHTFDVARFRGEDCYEMPFRERSEILRRKVVNLVPFETLLRIKPVQQWHSGFVAAYDQVIREGGEGLVVKKLKATGASARADGKTLDWVRAKPWRSVDYVVAGPGKTDLGELSAKLGIWENGKVRVVLQCQLPGLSQAADGRLEQEGRVVELYGREVFESGALRHAQFRRWRDDKRPEDCAGAETKLAEKPT